MSYVEGAHFTYRNLVDAYLIKVGADTKHPDRDKWITIFSIDVNLSTKAQNLVQIIDQPNTRAISDFINHLQENTAPISTHLENFRLGHGQVNELLTSLKSDIGKPNPDGLLPNQQHYTEFSKERVPPSHVKNIKKSLENTFVPMRD